MLSSFAPWDQFDPDQEFGKTRRREIERFGHLAIQPFPHFGIAGWPHRLRHHARVQDDHSKLAGSVGAGSRVISKSMPPSFLPNSASSEPILSRSSGRTAASRISLISPSVLFPLRVARRLSARCVSSGRLRMTTAGIVLPL